MKKSVLGLVAMGALIAGPAMAADMPVKAPPAPVAPAYSWTGFYIGGEVGGGWASETVTIVTQSSATPGFPVGFSSNRNLSGFLGGLTPASIIRSIDSSSVSTAITRGRI
jgi:outer membrane immunogenic protein